MSVVSYSPTDHRQTVLIGRSTCPRGGGTVGVPVHSSNKILPSRMRLAE